ncbi:response regulator transcription factor [Desulfofundulus thermosubterraneus]|uniref:Stage 0 sporulation protein A homolog n=1 Tax=Desulfofundulus thermosubterraneus DSM 16057 TaxID=1121432 RepID=A0A1M6DUP6_9FIRM|nr:response regulator transcription factor [Desulfofundulus thermosubterraneus]SHI76895.1 two component transcriptional regulator, LuxR family [Desulfofundulus thermosubterraneus DSM 16057]
MKTIGIMLVEDHNVFREGLKKLIDMEENMQVVAEADSCTTALQNMSPEVDVVLLDIGLPDGDGLDLCKRMTQTHPHIKFVALTTYDDVTFIRKAMEKGVHGFVPKYAFFDEIRSAINMVYKGGTYLYPGLQAELLLKPDSPVLTDQETSILQLIARGEDQKEVAAKLYISLSTLRRRIRGICTKLGVRTLEEALAAAARRGLVR